MDFFLGLIVFFILVWYGFKIFLRYGLPWLIARFVKKQQAKFNQQSNYQNAPPNREGDVHIKTDKSQKSKDDSDFGEYVDYEDVNE